jgi:hypothetical protein
MEFVSAPFSDPQLAALSGMIWVEKYIGPHKPPIIGPAPVIRFAEYKASVGDFG